MIFRSGPAASRSVRLILLLAAGGLGSTATSVTAAETWRIVNIDASSRVHMRQSASNRSKILAYIPGNERGLKSTHCISNWCRIEFRGIKGWVFSRYLAPDEGNAGSPKAAAAPDPEVLAQRKSFDLVHRDGRPIPIYAFPSDTLPIAGNVAPETKNVEGLGTCIEQWCYVRSGQLIGWMRTDAFALATQQAETEVTTAALSEPAEPQGDTAINETEPTATNAATVAAVEIDPPPLGFEAKTYALAGLAGDNALPIREKPEAASRILGLIPGDAKNVEGLRKCVERWCLIRYGNTDGWVLRRHLADETVEDTQTFQVSGLALWNALEVKDYPGEQAATVGTIPSYATGIVPIGGCDDVWCHIRYLGIAGWVSGRYLEPQKK
ncbi:MAG: hypothetical protein HC850_14175 [Rhodomicrobium sp.]|nr:hypothetical protein [Rhodomicrobium sp.]